MCEKCGHVWVAVYPVGTEQFECPECGHMTRLPLTVAFSDIDRSSGESWCASWDSRLYTEGG